MLKRQPSVATEHEHKTRIPAPSIDREAGLSQREKFIRAAREAGCDETGEALDDALRAIGRARKRQA